MVDTVTDEHKAGRGREEPPYFRACQRCEQPWPCPAKKQALQAEAEEMLAARAGESRRVGLLSLVEIGVSVWSSTRRNTYDEPLGGVVVDISDEPNRETGEFERFFTCLWKLGKRVDVHRIAEAEVVPTGVQATAGSILSKLIKALALEVAETKGSYIDGRCAERVRWQYVLTGVWRGA